MSPLRSFPSPDRQSGVFAGYASLFNVPDMSGDIIQKGAFQRSLEKRGSTGIKLLSQHRPSKLLGIWQDIHETPRGLYVRGHILTDISRGRDALLLMKAGALDGLSIGFQIVKAIKNPHGRGRLLCEVDLWEISLVTFPMLPRARVFAVG